MGLTALNYEMVLTRLNTEADENIKQEIEKRVKETAQLKREINDLKQQMKRSKDRKDRLEIEQKQLNEENEQKEQSNSIAALQLMHNKELQKLSYKLGHEKQLHDLELTNIRSTHQFEQDQLKAQIRAFTGSLERESRKDAKIQELTEENEELKADKELTALNYEMVLTRLNTE